VFLFFNQADLVFMFFFYRSKSFFCRPRQWTLLLR